MSLSRGVSITRLQNLRDVDAVGNGELIVWDSASSRYITSAPLRVTSGEPIITVTNAAKRGLLINLAAAQTADAFQVKNSAATTLLSISSAGLLTTAAGVTISGENGITWDTGSLKRISGGAVALDMGSYAFTVTTSGGIDFRGPTRINYDSNSAYLYWAASGAEAGRITQSSANLVLQLGLATSVFVIKQAASASNHPLAIQDSTGATKLLAGLDGFLGVYGATAGSISLDASSNGLLAIRPATGAYYPSIELRSAAAQCRGMIRHGTDANSSMEIYANNGGAGQKVVIGTESTSKVNIDVNGVYVQARFGMANSATATAMGTIVKAVPLYNESNTLLGYLPIYDGYS